MAQHLLLSSLFVGSCLFLLVSGQSVGNTLESFRVYTIGHGDCPAHKGQVLTAANGTVDVVFKDELKSGKGRRNQWFTALRLSKSTPEKEQWRFVNTGTMNNFVTNTVYVVNQTKDKKAYTLKCEDCKMCLSSAEGEGTQSVAVKEVECNADDKKQQFTFTLKKDDKAPNPKPSVFPPFSL